MSPVAALDAFLRARQLDAPSITGLVVALSAGPDSYALLCAAKHAASALDFRLRAVHVHHGLHPDADSWAMLAEQQAAAWQIPLQILRVQVPVQASIEDAARRARYDAIAALMSESEALLLAHHQDDQAETLLLRLMRGAGVQGLAAMREQSLWRSSNTQLPAMLRWRPWLGQSRQAITSWLSSISELPVVKDPANADPRFDRSLLRHQLLPLLQQRWPEASQLLARSSQQLAQQADALNELSDDLLQQLSGDGKTLDIPALNALSEASRQAVIARWLQCKGAPALPHRYWPRVKLELLQARADAQPQLAWAGWSLRRYRERLYLRHDELISELPAAINWPNPLEPIEWAGRLWSLNELCPHLNRNDQLLEMPWRIAPRVGGERLLIDSNCLKEASALNHQQHSISLKNWCQEQSIPPWQRDRLICIWAGEVVVAVHLMADEA